jgi:chromosome segregation ATPase
MQTITCRLTKGCILKHAVRLLGCTAILLLWVPVLHADIYSWTGKDGVKHFGNQPPENAADLKLIFKETPHNAAADQQRIETEQKEVNEIIKDLEEQEAQQAAEQKRKAEEAARNKPPTRQERIDDEKKRLEAKIAELEEKPLEYFGSQKNKRVRIGYYQYRLETLIQNPDKYFSQPSGFEGNVKEPAQ